MQSDVTPDVSLSGGSGTAVTNDLGWLDEVRVVQPVAWCARKQ